MSPLLDRWTLAAYGELTICAVLFGLPLVRRVTGTQHCPTWRAFSRASPGTWLLWGAVQRCPRCEATRFRGCRNRASIGRPRELPMSRARLGLRQVNPCCPKSGSPTATSPRWRSTCRSRFPGRAFSRASPGTWLLWGAVQRRPRCEATRFRGGIPRDLTPMGRGATLPQVRSDPFQGLQEQGFYRQAQGVADAPNLFWAPPVQPAGAPGAAPAPVSPLTNPVGQQAVGAPMPQPFTAMAQPNVSPAPSPYAIQPQQAWEQAQLRARGRTGSPARRGRLLGVPRGPAAHDDARPGCPK